MSTFNVPYRIVAILYKRNLAYRQICLNQENSKLITVYTILSNPIFVINFNNCTYSLLNKNNIYDKEISFLSNEWYHMYENATATKEHKLAREIIQVYNDF